MITADDVRVLTDHFGDKTALDVIWWSCRGNYMTRISNAFQIPLERKNVFKGRKKAGGAGRGDGVATGRDWRRRRSGGRQGVP